jgi:hypothetical protein
MQNGRPQKRAQGYARGRPWIKVVLLLLLGSAATGLPVAEPLRLSFVPGPANGAGPPAGWKPLTFKKIPQHTRYTLIRDGDAYVVKAEANASASGLIHPLRVDPRAYPILRWRWKVENLLPNSDVTRKEGDDYPARIYVAFAYDSTRVSLGQRIKYEAIRLIYGEYPPHAGLNYIWATSSAMGTVVPNPFTERVRMVVVDSGAARLGQWVDYERNIYEDYESTFGEPPPMISGIAIMTDGDNTGASATAYYGEIVLGPATP